VATRRRTRSGREAAATASPAAGPHRLGEPLKLGFEGLHSARRGDYRIIYRIDDERYLVIVMAIEHRSGIYRPRRL
jgi:mRNA interferase RelE/StbE